MWCFDLAVRQITQENIAEAYRGQVNGQWKSIISFFDMSSFIVAMVCYHPEQFVMLTTMSAIMVSSAAILYTASNISARSKQSAPPLRNSSLISDEAIPIPLTGPLHTRKDKTTQPSGSILGDKDHNPAVVKLSGK